MKQKTSSALVAAAQPSGELSKLIASEQTRLRDCETIITAGMDTFMSVAQALLYIREDRLYRETHGTFEAYCQDKWQMSSRRARQICTAADVVQDIRSELGPVATVPQTESQARPLAALPKVDRAKVWSDAVSTANSDPPKDWTTRDPAPADGVVKAAPAIPPSRTAEYRNPKKDQVIVIYDAATPPAKAPTASQVKAAVARHQSTSMPGQAPDADPNGRPWPIPNQHGVYSDSDACVIQIAKPHFSAKICVLQAGVDAWRYGFAVSINGSSEGCGGFSAPLNSGAYPCYSYALYSAMEDIRDGIASRDNKSATAKRSARDILKWIESIPTEAPASAAAPVAKQLAYSAAKLRAINQSITVAYDDVRRLEESLGTPDSMVSRNLRKLIATLNDIYDHLKVTIRVVELVPDKLPF